MIEMAEVLADTPSAEELVFLDSAGSSLPPAQVTTEVVGHLRREAEVGGYRAAAERADDLAEGYHLLAELLDCQAAEVAFTDSATRSWFTLLDAVPLAAGDRVLISEVEYGANAVALLRLAERVGASVDVVPSDETGQLDVEALRARLDERVKLVSLVHVPTNSGLVNPVGEVVAAAHDAGALVLLDACQSVGQLPVGLAKSGVDMLSGTGRKWLRGPRGTGFLAVRADVMERLSPRLVDHAGAEWIAPTSYRLRHDAKVHELWEFGVAERLGLLAAVRYALRMGIDEITATVAERSARLRAGLAAIDGVTVHDLGRVHGGIVTFTVRGRDATAVKDALWRQHIAVSVNLPQASRIDMTRRGLAAVVRASPHYFVTSERIDRAIASVAALAAPG